MHFFIDFAAGDQQDYDVESTAYKALKAWLAAQGPSYGLPSSLEAVRDDEVARETLASIYEAQEGVSILMLPSCRLLTR